MPAFFQDFLPGSFQDFVPGSFQDFVPGSFQDFVPGSFQDFVPGSFQDFVPGSFQDFLSGAAAPDFLYTYLLLLSHFHLSLTSLLFLSDFLQCFRLGMVIHLKIESKGHVQNC